MLLKKDKDLFIDVTSTSVYAGQVSYMGGETMLQGIKKYENKGLDKDFGRQLKADFEVTKGAYYPAYLSVHAESTFVEKVLLETPVKARESGYVDELLTKKFKIDPKKYSICYLNGTDGLEFDPEKVLQKEIIACGALSKEILESQDNFVKMGFCPERLELGKMSNISGMLSYSETVDKSFIIFLQLGEKGSLISIIHKGSLLLNSYIGFGVKDLIPNIQQELGLEDEKTAQELLYSKTFDFAQQGDTLLKDLVRELQTSIDYFEVNTGHRVESIFVHAGSNELDWMGAALANALRVNNLKLNYLDWVNLAGVNVSPELNLSELGDEYLGLMSLLSTCALDQGGEA